MNRTQITALANAIQNIRPDWQQPGIIAQLNILNSNWAGTDAALSLHAMTIAAAPQAQTPGAFNAAPPEPTPPPPVHHSHAEPKCFICGQPRSACARRRGWEIHRGIPDPHEFETLEEADQRTTGSKR